MLSSGHLSKYKKHWLRPSQCFLYLLYHLFFYYRQVTYGKEPEYAGIDEFIKL